MEPIDEAQDTAYKAGWKAFWDGVRYVKNPHTRHSDLSDFWANGWLAAESDAVREAYRDSPEAYRDFTPIA